MSSTLQKLIEAIIKEAIAPEATPPSNPFGNWLAPQDRSLDVEEEDTPEEVEMIDALRTFMGKENDPSKLSANGGEKAKELVGLMKKHQYAPVLNPGGGMAYRGLSFTDANSFLSVIKQYGGNVKTLQILVEDGGTPATITVEQLQQYLVKQEFFVVYGSIGPFAMQPAGSGKLVQSWTADLNVAASDFVNKNSVGGTLVVANTTKNMFFGRPGEIGKIGGFPEEKETISVGAVNVEGAKFVYGPYVSNDEIQRFLLK